jgi:hypothetical protein
VSSTAPRSKTSQLVPQQYVQHGIYGTTHHLPNPNNPHRLNHHESFPSLFPFLCLEATPAQQVVTHRPQTQIMNPQILPITTDAESRREIDTEIAAMHRAMSGSQSQAIQMHSEHHSHRLAQCGILVAQRGTRGGMVWRTQRLLVGCM